MISHQLDADERMEKYIVQFFVYIKIKVDYIFIRSVPQVPTDNQYETFADVSNERFSRRIYNFPGLYFK